MVVESQLGRKLRAPWAVARRCHLGVPMVIESFPRADDGSPFPTLYWLTCPILVKRASRLEATGAMSDLNEELREDGSLRRRLEESLAGYVRRRDEHAVIEDRGAPPGGGPDRVKCLHAHVAHEVATSANPVGARVLATAGWPDCRTPCVERVAR